MWCYLDAVVRRCGGQCRNAEMAVVAVTVADGDHTL